MAAFNNASSPVQSIPSPQLSIVDVFLPGFTGTSLAIQQLLAGNLGNYGGLLCVCGTLMFFGRRVYESLQDLVDKFLSS